MNSDYIPVPYQTKEQIKALLYDQLVEMPSLQGHLLRGDELVLESFTSMNEHLDMYGDERAYSVRILGKTLGRNPNEPAVSSRFLIQADLWIDKAERTLKDVRLQQVTLFAF